MRYAMKEIRHSFFDNKLDGKVIKFLWFFEKGKKPKKCRAKMRWIGSNKEYGNFLLVIGLKMGRAYLGNWECTVPLRDIVLLADNGLERCTLLGNSLNYKDSDLTLPEDNSVPHIEIKNPSKSWSPCSGEGCQHPSHNTNMREVK